MSFRKTKLVKIRKMKTQVNLKHILVFGLFTLIIGISNVQAQRTVVRTPGRTVVRTPSHTTVVRKPRVYTTYPVGAVAVSYGGVSFRCHRGVYYKPLATGYVVVPAPIGLRVRVLPPVYRTMVVSGHTYYYYHGAYYIKRWGGYKVVAPPATCIVTTLPASHKTVIVKGTTYYAFNGAHYEKIILESGSVQYCKVIL